MKKIILLLGLVTLGFTQAQEVQNKEITEKNSWLKLGMQAGLPTGDTSDAASFTLGVDARGQFLLNPNFGIGVATGYHHYFGKNNFDDFGVIPLAAFARYYFKEDGPYIGLDLGYGFISGIKGTDGGLYLNPQIGYNTYNWNFYLFYQHTDGNNNAKVQAFGIGATYNLRFNN